MRIYKEIYDGYGYGASLYYPDLFLYFPAVLCLIGIPLSYSYNIFLLCVNIVTLCIAYYSFSKITGSEWVGLIAALLYELSSYRLLDIYTRGSVGEVLALMFCPLALCGLHLIAKGQYEKWWFLTLAFCGLLQSHILSFVLITIVAIGYVLIHYKAYFNKKAIGAVCFATFTTILLNLWFLVPFFEASQTKVIAMIDNNGFWATDASIAQIFDMLLLSVVATESWTDIVADTIPKTPGITLILGGVLSCFSLIIYKKETSSHKQQLGGYLAAGLFATFLITNLFPWRFIQKIPVLNSFFTKYQFIWRFNILAVLFLSVAAAYGFYYFFIHFSADFRKSFVLVCMVICCFAMIFMNQYVKQAGQYTNEEVMQNGYMDKLYVVPGFAYGCREDLTSNFSEVVFSDIDKKDCEISFQFDAGDGEFHTEEAGKAFVEVPITFYPGYEVLLDGQKAEHECSIWGIIRILIPEEYTKGNIEVYYHTKLVWKICEVISVLTALVLGGYILLQVTKKK